MGLLGPALTVTHPHLCVQDVDDLLRSALQAEEVSTSITSNASTIDAAL